MNSECTHKGIAKTFSCISKERVEPLFYKSICMQNAMETVAKVSALRAVVLIYGKPGTGKRLLAEIVHRRSKYNRGAFVTINCRGKSEQYLREQIFGTKKIDTSQQYHVNAGALAMAKGGTILIRNIDYLPKSIQLDMLRVIQERFSCSQSKSQFAPCNVRILATMELSPSSLLSRGFRKDLFFRITTYTIRMGTLRERIEDLPDLIEHFLGRFLADNENRPLFLSEAAFELMSNYDWPGNVSELKHALKEVVANLKPAEDIIDIEHLPRYLQIFQRLSQADRTRTLKTNLRLDAKTTKMGSVVEWRKRAPGGPNRLSMLADSILRSFLIKRATRNGASLVIRKPIIEL